MGVDELMREPLRKASGGIERRGMADRRRRLSSSPQGTVLTEPAAPRPARAEAVLAEIAHVRHPNRCFSFCEHAPSGDPVPAKWQERLAGPWSVFGQGCRCNRRTLVSISGTFGGVEIAPGTWRGMPATVRPPATGRAIRAGKDGRQR
ncbi:hypothetical protein LCL87_23155 [Rhodococcus hoagii]|nr:hypothetical protein [Prescottella equi]